MSEIPYMAVGNDELGRPVQDKEPCPHCGKMRKVTYGERILSDGSREPSKMLGFVKCGKKSYLVAIDEKVMKPRRAGG